MPNTIMRKLFVFFLALLGIAAFWFAAGRPQRIQEPGIAAGDRLQSVSYAPFVGDQSPFDFAKGLTITDQRLDTDVSILSRQFSCIRTYAAGGLEALPRYAEKHGMQLLLGAWVSGSPEATRQELDNAIALARKYPGVIRAVVVGNEALLRQEVSASQLAAYLRYVKSALPEVPVTYADVWEFWLKYPEVAKDVDFLTVHILPYWEDNPVAIDDAMAHVRQVREKILGEIPGKEILIGETGWPSRGRMREGALPSPANQARYLRGFIAMAERGGWQYNVIEAFDQPWKRMKEGAVGGYWGLYDRDRNDKHVLSGAVAAYPGWQELLGLTAGIALLAFAVTPLPAALSAAGVLRLTAALAAGAVLLVVQGEEFSIISVDRLDILWAVLVLAVAADVYLVSLRALAGGTVLPYSSLDEALAVPRGPSRWTAASLGGMLRLAALACALIAAVCLAFQGRQLSFNNAAFFIPALAYAVLGGRPQDRPATGLLEKGIALLLAAAGLGVFLPEPHNLQAAVWAGICLLLAWPLWRAGHRVSLRPLLPFALFALITGGLLYVLRQKTVTAEAMVAVCAESPNAVICQLRELLGKMIHFKVYGWTSLALAGIAICCNLLPLTLLALAAALAGLIFYNAGMSAVAMVLILLSLAHRSASHRL